MQLIVVSAHMSERTQKADKKGLITVKVHLYIAAAYLNMTIGKSKKTILTGYNQYKYTSSNNFISNSLPAGIEILPPLYQIAKSGDPARLTA